MRDNMDKNVYQQLEPFARIKMIFEVARFLLEVAVNLELDIHPHQVRWLPPR